MNLLDLQIAFQQKIEDINQVFGEEQRPDSYVIVNYLNKAINKYLEKKYINLPSFEHRLAAIDNNIDELSGLITSEYTLLYERSMTNFNWGARAKRYRVPEDMLFPISLSCTVTRTEIYPMTTQKIFAEFVSRRQAEKIVSNTSDKVMYPKPVVCWEDPYYLIVVADAYTTSITAGPLAYIRKPYTLGYNYLELTATETSNLDISDIPDDTYFLMKTYSKYYNPEEELTSFSPGSKVLKMADYDAVTNYLGTGEVAKVGYPWGYTDTPDFPPYLHTMLVDMAVELFMDEAKLKLIQKAEK